MAEHATTAHESNPPAAEGHHHGRYHPHVVPLWLLGLIFAVLLVLTVITVAVTNVDLGMMNLPIALLIAAIKASLVVLYFMHLRWDSPFNSVVIVTAFLFLALFLWFSTVDAGQYRESLERTVEREGLAPMLQGGAVEAAGQEAGGAEGAEGSGGGEAEAEH